MSARGERPQRPYETPAFQHDVTYTVAITYTVAGGARSGTADRRAQKLAEQLVNRAAGARHIVDVSAVAGSSYDGTIVWPERVRFSAANSDHGTAAEPGKLDRWLDADHELALRALAEQNAAAEGRRRADGRRRTQVDCANAWPSIFEPAGAFCECVYCRPAEHLAATGWDPASSALCLCGVPVALASERCLDHRGVDLVVLDGDPPALRLLADDLSAGGQR